MNTSHNITQVAPALQVGGSVKLRRHQQCVTLKPALLFKGHIQDGSPTSLHVSLSPVVNWRAAVKCGYGTECS